MKQQFNHNAFLLARESRGISQNELAMETKIPQTILSRIEHGIKTDISKDTIDRLSQALQYPETFFFQEGCIFPVSTEFQYRKGSKLKISEQKRIEANANITRLQLNKLLQTVEFETNIKHFELDEYNDNPVEIAKATRLYWRTPRGPLSNITELAESVGIIIILADFNTNLVSGFSIYSDKYPLIFINKDIPGDRYRFTIAHEIAHIIMHVTRTPTMEKEANEFASEFLMPEYDIQDELQNLSLKKLADLKQYWKVSMAAIAKRANDLKKISDTQYRYICMQMSSAGYRKKEPFELPKEKPALIDELIKIHIEQLGYSIEDLSNIFNISIDEFKDKYFNKNNRFKIFK